MSIKRLFILLYYPKRGTGISLLLFGLVLYILPWGIGYLFDTYGGLLMQISIIGWVIAVLGVVVGLRWFFGPRRNIEDAEDPWKNNR